MLKKFLEGAVGSTWIAGAVSAIGTVTLGLMHASETAFPDMPAADAHREAGRCCAWPGDQGQGRNARTCSSTPA
jgi:hypothetical protein